MDATGDSQPLRGPPLRAVVLCCVFMLLQGLDTFGISYVAPLLGADFGIAPAQIGLVFAASVLASLLGAIGIAPLSDRFGRRWVLLLAILLTGAPSLLIPLTRDMHVLLVLRFIVGLGFGASLPVAVALVSDFAPPRMRALLVTLTSTSTVVGMSIAGLAASLMVPRLGWQSLLYASGIASLVMVAVGAFLLPESRAPLSSPQAAPAPPLRAVPPPDARALLQPQLLLRSVLFSVTLMMAYLVLNFAVYWLPTVIINQGYSMADTGLIGSTRQFMTVVLGFIVGWTMDRLGAGRVLTMCYAVAAVLFLSITGLSMLAAVTLGIMLLGMTILSAGLSGTLALASSCYPREIRATALGWVQGTGRVVGGSIGTFGGGVLVGAGWTQRQLALVIGMVTVVGLIALIAAVRSARR